MSICSTGMRCISEQRKPACGWEYVVCSVHTESVDRIIFLVVASKRPPRLRQVERRTATDLVVSEVGCGCQLRVCLLSGHMLAFGLR